MLCAGLALAGCSFISDMFSPSMSGEEPSESAAPPATMSKPASATQQNRSSATQQNQSAAAQSNQPPTLSPEAPPTLGTGQFNPPGVTPGRPTGTFVGQKVIQFRSELQRLQDQIRDENQSLQAIRHQTVLHSVRYHSVVGAIEAKLQVGTTPGNPIVVSQWNAAQGLLDQIGSDVAQMNTLANRVSGTSTLSSYLLESVRAAYGLSGAVDEDHRQLTILEDEVNRTVVTIDRLLNELSTDISRQSAYLATARSNLTALSLAVKNGELYGESLANRAFQSSAPVAAPTALPGEAARRPLVVIRFDRPNVDYAQALYMALSGALNRRPNAMFDLVAVAPQSGSPAQVTRAQNQSKRDAERVLRSMSEMGLPMDRVRLSAMTSPSVETNEVHIYVR